MTFCESGDGMGDVEGCCLLGDATPMAWGDGGDASDFVLGAMARLRRGAMEAMARLRRACDEG